MTSPCADAGRSYNFGYCVVGDRSKDDRCESEAILHVTLQPHFHRLTFPLLCCIKNVYSAYIFNQVSCRTLNPANNQTRQSAWTRSAAATTQTSALTSSTRKFLALTSLAHAAFVTPILKQQYRAICQILLYRSTFVIVPTCTGTERLSDAE